MAGEQDEPVPPSRPRRRLVPAAGPRARRDPGFSTEVPRRGWADARYILDTGVLFAAAIDAGCGEHVRWHYRDRLHTTSVIVDEVRHRAANPTDKPGLLDAAREAMRLFVDDGAVSVDDVEPRDAAKFDEVLQQLRELERAKRRRRASRHDRDRHGGEASAIVVCLREIERGTRVVFATNDGDASRIAHSRNVHTRHFGHVLHELVCADAYRAGEAFALFERANEISGLPRIVLPQGEEDLSCHAVSNGCAACG